MTRKLFLETEFSDNVIVVCNEIDLARSLNSFMEFIQMTSESMSAEALIASLPRLQKKKISMILLEGQENIKRILNRSFELRHAHPDLQFILLLDEPSEAVNAQEHFSFVRFLKKSEVIERISILMGFVHSGTEQHDLFHKNVYKPNPSEHHSIDRYV